MLILFTGSRDWTNWRLVERVVADLYYNLGPFTVLQGGACGVDLQAVAAARLIGLEAETVRPRYDLYGRYEAPKRRNIEMLQKAPAYVVGFWDGVSGGTLHCLDWAVNHFRIPTLIYTATE